MNAKSKWGAAMIELLLFAAVACLLGLAGAKFLDDRFDRQPGGKRDNLGSDTPLA
jgi:hypothetical protein